MRLLIALAIVGAMLFGADLFLRTVTETRAENQMESVLDLRNKPDVTLGGWPFVIKALSGNFPSISLEIANERVRGVELSNISLEVRDVELDLGSLLSDSSEAVRMGGGEGTAALTEEALARAFAAAASRATSR
jgi:hypothetical protein